MKQIFKITGIIGGSVALIVWSLFPYIYAVIFSFSGARLPTKLGLPDTFSLAAYKEVLVNNPIWPYFFNSISVAGATCIVVALISIPAAYSCSRYKKRKFSSIFYIFLIFRMIPYITLALPLFFLMNRMGLIDTRAALILTYALIQIPLGVWLMKGFFDMIPPELEEAALVDGASKFTTFIRIVLPLAASEGERLS